jgi:hypothetical protein
MDSATAIRTVSCSTPLIAAALCSSTAEGPAATVHQYIRAVKMVRRRA